MADIPDTQSGMVSEKGKVAYHIVNKFVQLSAAGTAELWAATADKKHHITDIIVSVDTAMTVKIQDGSNDILVVYLAANGGFIMNFQTPLIGSVNTAINVTTESTGNCSVTVTGYDD